jgi:hypothetical protein
VVVADKRVSAMTYVGHGIRASVSPMAEHCTDLSQPEGLSDVRVPARRQRAPCADEH